MNTETTAKTAQFIRNLDYGFRGDARLYKVTPPMAGHNDVDMHDYVIVSAVDVPCSGPETYVFGADENGVVRDWLELDGSYRGGLSHEEALEGAGYTVEDQD